MAKEPKIRYCKNCNSQLPGDSTICPQCGANNKNPVYKRAWFIILCVIVVFGIIGAATRGGNEDPQTDNSNNVATEKETIPEISLDETITTDDFEFTLNKVKLSYSVKPENTSSAFYSYYEADEGQVYIYVNASVKNLKQRDVSCDEVYDVIANYNNGYTYEGFNIVTDTDGDFSYASITDITPLQTLGIHCLIDCPEEVETSDNPLTLTIKFRNGEEYLYRVR